MGRVKIYNSGNSPRPDGMYSVFTKALPSGNIIRQTDMRFPETNKVVAIRYGNGRYIASVGESSSGWSSTDAKTWTSITFPFPVTYDGAAFDEVNNVFYIMSSTTNYIAKSADGSVWTQISCPDMLETGGGRCGPIMVNGYILIWNKYNGTPKASQNGGSTWSTVPLQAYTNDNLQMMVYAGGRYYASKGAEGIHSSTSISSGWSKVLSVRAEGIMTDGTSVITFSNFISNQTTKLFYRANAGTTAFSQYSGPVSDSWKTGVYDNVLKKFIVGGQTCYVASDDGLAWKEVNVPNPGIGNLPGVYSCGQWTYLGTTAIAAIQIVDTLYEQTLFFEKDGAIYQI